MNQIIKLTNPQIVLLGTVEMNWFGQNAPQDSLSLSLSKYKVGL